MHAIACMGTRRSRNWSSVLGSIACHTRSTHVSSSPTTAGANSSLMIATI